MTNTSDKKLADSVHDKIAKHLDRQEQIQQKVSALRDKVLGNIPTNMTFPNNMGGMPGIGLGPVSVDTKKMTNCWKELKTDSHNSFAWHIGSDRPTNLFNIFYQSLVQKLPEVIDKYKITKNYATYGITKVEDEEYSWMHLWLFGLSAKNLAQMLRLPVPAAGAKLASNPEAEKKVLIAEKVITASHIDKEAAPKDPKAGEPGVTMFALSPLENSPLESSEFIILIGNMAGIGKTDET